MLSYLTGMLSHAYLLLIEWVITQMTAMNQLSQDGHLYSYYWRHRGNDIDCNHWLASK